VRKAGANQETTTVPPGDWSPFYQRIRRGWNPGWHF